MRIEHEWSWLGWLHVNNNVKIRDTLSYTFIHSHKQLNSLEMEMKIHRWKSMNIVKLINKYGNGIGFPGNTSSECALHHHICNAPLFLIRITLLQKMARALVHSNSMQYNAIAAHIFVVQRLKPFPAVFFFSLSCYCLYSRPQACPLSFLLQTNNIFILLSCHVKIS